MKIIKSNTQKQDILDKLVNTEVEVSMNLLEMLVFVSQFGETVNSQKYAHIATTLAVWYDDGDIKNSILEKGIGDYRYKHLDEIISYKDMKEALIEELEKL